jgi:hypothetical protein
MLRNRHERILRWRDEQADQISAAPEKPERSVRRRVSDTELFSIMRTNGAMGTA